MRSAWLVWFLFAACLVVVLSAMGWISLTAIRLDRSEATARHQAAFEENVRLALWRMDSALSPLLAQESARPYFVYETFLPVRRSYGQMFNDIPGGNKGGKTGGKKSVEPVVPSPLLGDLPSQVLVHFQFDPEARLSSPCVPNGSDREMAVPTNLKEARIDAAERYLKQVEALIDRSRLLALLPKPSNEPRRILFSPLPSTFVQDNRNEPIAQQASRPQGQRQQAVYQPNIKNQSGSQPYLQNPSFTTNYPNQGDQQQQQVEQQLRGYQDFQYRNNAVVMNTDYADQNGLNQFNLYAPTETDVSGVVMTPLWIDDELLLARPVVVKGRTYVQGCLLDWPAIETWLLEMVTDLLPDADLQPVIETSLGDESRRLAAMPVRLVAGQPAPLDPGRLSPIRLSLVVAWICVLLAAAAVAMLVAGVMRLSQRRAAFVSAVTHELRTPLTTFHLYTDMLAEGMVTDNSQRQNYLDTLRSEAARLTHLVENVLSYARLERGRANGVVDDMVLADVLADSESRLSDRARQTGMTWIVEQDERALTSTVRANASVVEQILLNLVDNACKYATEAADRRIHLSMARTDRGVELAVRDHGPGIDSTASRRLFRSFSKSAKEAADSAPGVGLGLALSRRLAHDMGARLEHDPLTSDGARFVLTLGQGDVG